MAEDKDEADLVTNMVIEKKGNLRRKSVFQRGMDMLKQFAHPERVALENEFQEKIKRRKTEIEKERKKTGLVRRPSFKLDLEDYYVSRDPAKLEHRAVTNLIEDLPDIRDHIVICGSFNDLYHFLLPLRDKRYEEMFPIVILHHTPPTALEWAQIGHFDATYYVKGRASDVDDLKRSGIGYAARAIILAGSGAADDENNTGWNGHSFVETLDAETIFTFRVISQTNPHIPVLCELVVSGNISLLSNESDNAGTGEDFMYAHYAAGQVYSSSMTDILASQSFYNPHVRSGMIFCMKEM